MLHVPRGSCETPFHAHHVLGGGWRNKKQRGHWTILGIERFQLEDIPFHFYAFLNLILAPTQSFSRCSFALSQLQLAP